VETKTRRDVLALAAEGAAQEILQAVAAFARALPVGDEAGNDAIYAAWVRSRSEAIGKLIAEQGRQPATPALEALHALVTGRLERYAALKDQDGTLLVQAFALAPEPFHARLAQSVAASPDRAIKDAYRRALTSGAVDPAQGVENLKLVGDEDGLFEQPRSLRLLEVLDLSSVGRSPPPGARRTAPPWSGRWPAIAASAALRSSSAPTCPTGWWTSSSTGARRSPAMPICAPT
jgi:hypothetical protein